MFGHIILRDIPKEAIQLDLSIYEITGEFRGFSEVPPGIHYINIEVDGAMRKGFWCFVYPSSVVVKTYDYNDKEFKNDTPENEAEYSNMALSGVMNQALIPVMQESAESLNEWLELVSHIEKDHFPVSLSVETPDKPPEDRSLEEMEEYFLIEQKSWFEQALFETHKGNSSAFLAEFQFAFARSLVEKTAEKAFDRWLQLLQAIYNAGERSIGACSELFSSLIDTIIIQFRHLPDDWFSSDSKLVYYASYLIKDMIATEIESLEKKAQEFAEYLESRGVYL